MKSARKMIDAALSLDKNDLVAHFCKAYLALRRKAQEKSQCIPKGSNILAEGQKSKLQPLGVAAIIFIGVLLYSNTLHAPFIFDDYSSIVDNDAIKDFTIS